MTKVNKGVTAQTNQDISDRSRRRLNDDFMKPNFATRG